MNAFRVVSVAFALWLNLGPGLTEPDTPSAFNYQRAERLLQQKKPNEKQLMTLLGQAKALLTDPPKLARALAENNVSADYELSAKAQTELRKFVEVGGQVSNSGGSLSIGDDVIRWKASTNPNDRVLGSTLEVFGGVLPNGGLVKHVFSIEFQYADNRKYLEAMGVDAGNLPGARTALKMMDGVLGRHSQDVPAGQSPPPGVIEGVTAELKQLLPPIFVAQQQYEKVTVGQGIIVEDVTGNVSVSHSTFERIGPGQTTGQGVQFSETSFSGGLSANLTEKTKAGVELALKVSTDPEKAPDPNKAELVTLLAQGLVGEVAKRGIDQFAPVLQPERIQQALALLDKQGQPQTADPSRLVAVADPKVGGVRLYYDPGMLATDVPPSAVARVLDRLLDQQQQGHESFVVSAASGEWRLQAVSMRQLLADPGATTLGTLTRVRGFVQRSDGDFLVLGEVEPDGAPIALDLFVAALQAIWRSGEFPFVSLDPDPLDFGGAQRVRVGGVPAALQKSEFVRTMLEADYALKRITLGEDVLAVPGYRNTCELAAATPPSGEVMSRLWLVPMPSRTADVWEWSAAGATAVLFDSRVQVLTETMKRVQDYLLGAGEADPLWQAEAAGFTAHYAEIAGQREQFRRLDAVFDVAKLCAILRDRKVVDPLLMRLAERPVPSVEIPDHYQGIGLKQVEGTRVVVSGGANSRVRLNPNAYAKTEALAALLAVGDGQEVGLVYPTTVGLSTTEALGAEAEIVFNRGVVAFSKGDYLQTESLMTMALQRDREFASARLYRGIGRYARGERKLALADLDLATKAIPEAQALRGLLRAGLGDKSGALQDAAAAAKAFPDNEAVLTWNSSTYVYTFDLPKAEAATERLLSMNPVDPDAAATWTMLELLYKLGPQRARERVEQIRRVPLLLYDTYSDGITALQRFALGESIDKLKRCLAMIDAATGDPAVVALHLQERAEMGLLIALSSQSKLDQSLGTTEGESPLAVARSYADALVKRHPDWPTVYLLRGMFLPDADMAQLLAVFDKALRYKGNADPLLEDLSAHLGTNPTLAWFGISLFYQANEQGRSGPELATLLEKILPVMGKGPEVPLLKALRDTYLLPAEFEKKLKAALLSFGDQLPPEVRDAIDKGVSGQAFFDVLDKFMPDSKIDENDSRAKQVKKAFDDGLANKLRPLRAATQALPERIPNEPVTVWSVGVASLIYLTMEFEQGDPAIATDAALKCLRQTDVDELPHATWTQVGVFRMALLGMLGERFHRQFEQDPRWEKFKTQLGAGEVDLLQIRKALDGAKADIRNTVLRAGSPFAVAFVEFGFSGNNTAPVERELHDLATEAVPQVVDPARREREQHELDAWTAQLNPAPKDRADLLGGLLTSATRPADLYCLNFLTTVFTAGSQAVAQEDPIAAAEIDRAVLQIQSRMRGLQLKRKGHDWGKWGKEG